MYLHSRPLRTVIVVCLICNSYFVDMAQAYITFHETIHVLPQSFKRNRYLRPNIELMSLTSGKYVEREGSKDGEPGRYLFEEQPLAPLNCCKIDQKAISEHDRLKKGMGTKVDKIGSNIDCTKEDFVNSNKFKDRFVHSRGKNTTHSLTFSSNSDITRDIIVDMKSNYPPPLDRSWNGTDYNGDGECVDERQSQSQGQIGNVVTEYPVENNSRYDHEIVMSMNEKKKKSDIAPVVGKYEQRNRKINSHENKSQQRQKISRREFLCSTAGASTAVAISLAEVHAAAPSRVGLSSDATDSDSAMSIPFSSTRKYRYLTLSNGLRVVLASDRRTSRQSASLSIGGAGQLSDSDDLPGLAHLMEHMSLSSTGKSSSKARKGPSNFEEWFTDRDGASNAFTSPGSVNFHFSCDKETIQEALGRFGELFVQERVEEVCRDGSVLAREVRRVDAEISGGYDLPRSYYLLKHLMNPVHPFSRFAAGNLDTLERRPREAGIDVGARLRNFFQKYYLPERAVLAVVSTAPLATLERWIAPFSSILVRSDHESLMNNDVSPKPVLYPEPFPSRLKSKFPQFVLQLSPKDDTPFRGSVPKLSMEWPLQLIYDDSTDRSISSRRPIVAAPVLGFVLSQALGGRGPSSIYRFLRRRNWNAEGLVGEPRISFPVDVSAFQILRLEIGLTVEGFTNRSAVIAAFYKIINSMLPRDSSSPTDQWFPLPSSGEMIRQCLTVAYLHGYVLAPRPPDAVELAADAQTHGVGKAYGVGVTGTWPLVPRTDDASAVEYLGKIVANTLKIMGNPSSNVIAIIAATPRIISASNYLRVGTSIPSVTSGLWRQEPISRAPYLMEEVTTRNLDGLVKKKLVPDWFENELNSPLLNPFVPENLRQARPQIESIPFRGGRFYYADDAAGPSSASWRGFIDQSSNWAGGDYSLSNNRADWKLWQIAPGSTGTLSLPLPQIFRDAASPRCSFVIQLLSSRPTEATSVQAARAQLWQLSFEDAITDLTELGAPGALAYDIGFNQFGLRICFLGISQNLPSYTRQFCKMLVEHHPRLIDGSEKILSSLTDKAVYQAKKAFPTGIRRRETISAICGSKVEDVGIEGKKFFRSCGDVVCLAQGDFLPSESITLLEELQEIFRDILPDKEFLNPVPELREVLYPPMWKPRSASACFIPGGVLISDACGRVKR